MATDGSNATAAVDATAADATAADATAADATAADAAPTIMMPMAMAAAEEDEENSASARQSLQNLKALQRKMARDKYKAKLKHESRSRIDSEAKAASAWLPPSLGSAGLWKNIPVVGEQFDKRFHVDSRLRVWTAARGFQHGISVHLKMNEVVASCNGIGCHMSIKAQYCRRLGLWEICKVVPHVDACSGAPVTAASNGKNDKVKYCMPAYQATQVARIIRPSLREDPNLSTYTVRKSLTDLNLFLRQPDPTFYRHVKTAALAEMEKQRDVEMAALPGYVELLRDLGHDVEVELFSAEQMRQVRYEAVKYINARLVSEGKITAEDARFDAAEVDVSDIVDGEEYYAGWRFVPNFADTFLLRCRKFGAADGAHCLGKGQQSYGTASNVVMYDANYNVQNIVTTHSAAAEGTRTWGPVKKSLRNLSNFDVEGRVLGVDMEKSIGILFESCEYASGLFDPRHVVKNLLPAVPKHQKATCKKEYEAALYAPSKARVAEAKSKMSSGTAAFMDRYPDHQLYKACAGLQDDVVSSQASECINMADLQTNVRSVEPVTMLHNALAAAQRRFRRAQTAAETCTKPVPPRVEEKLAKLALKAEMYTGKVTWIEGSGRMEAQVQSLTGGRPRVVQMPTNPQTPPSCCSYSTEDDKNFPCYHAAAAIIDKHGVSSLHKFVSERNTTSTWKLQYEGLDFKLPSTADYEDVLLRAKMLVEEGRGAHRAHALLPPRGRPSGNTGTRHKSWFEQGPGGAVRKRKYACKLCGDPGHVRNNCRLRQELGDEEGDSDEDDCDV